MSDAHLYPIGTFAHKVADTFQGLDRATIDQLALIHADYASTEATGEALDMFDAWRDAAQAEEFNALAESFGNRTADAFGKLAKAIVKDAALEINQGTETTEHADEAIAEITDISAFRMGK